MRKDNYNSVFSCSRKVLEHFLEICRLIRNNKEAKSLSSLSGILKKARVGKSLLIFSGWRLTNAS